MQDKELIEKTARYFNVSEEKAAKMIAEQKKRTEATQERAALMLESINQGHNPKGGIWI